MGIRNAILRDFSSVDIRKDKGAIWESFVFLKLQTILGPNKELKFWRTKDGGEVDFILLENRMPIPIEVKSDLKDKQIPPGLVRFLKRYPKTQKAFVVSQKLRGELKWKSSLIRFLTFNDFEEGFQKYIV